MEIHALLKQVTRQRSEELDALTDGVTFRRDDNAEGIGFEASSNWKLVRVTMRCQSRLWAHCYAYYCTFTEFAARQTGSDTELAGEQLKIAGDLLEWAVASDIKIRLEGGNGFPVALADAPVHSPLPFEPANAGAVRGRAGMIFLHALAFILHHELAHIQLGHVGAEGDLAIQQEFDADAAAAQWILGAPIEDEFDYLVRHLGVAIALIWFTSLAFREQHVARSHPPSWERLLAALEPSVRREEDVIWGFVVLALTLHFHRHCLPIDNFREFAPTRATVVEMIESIKQYNRGLNRGDN